MLIRCLTHQQYPGVPKYRAAHAQLWGGVAGLLGEQNLDVRHIRAGVLGHDFSRQGAEPLVTLAIILVARKGETGLRQCLNFARP